MIHCKKKYANFTEALLSLVNNTFSNLVEVSAVIGCAFSKGKIIVPNMATIPPNPIILLFMTFTI